MTPIVAFVVLGLVHFPIAGIAMWIMFRTEIKQWWRKRRMPPKQTHPTCMYCRSKWTSPCTEGYTRWDDQDLVLVTEYECDHCRLPFWHVERVSTTVVPS